jgi:flagellar protein FlaJ
MFEKFTMKLFGDLTSPYLDFFESLNQNLKKARIGLTVHEYINNILFYSLMVFIVALVLSSIFITLLIPQTLYAYTLGIIISMVSSGGAFFMGYAYPGIKAKGLEAKINRSLPFTVSYMATSAASGMSPVEIFKVVSLRGGVVGEEANKIYTNVKSLGMSLPDAMQRTANTSPSTQFSDLLWGMTSVINAGGNLESYLRNRTRTFMSQYRRLLEDYANSVTFYTEIYITLVIVGSLFFIVLTSILSPLTGGGSGLLMLQTFLVFFFVPFVSAGFIVLLKGISPSE